MSLALRPTWDWTPTWDTDIFNLWPTTQLSGQEVHELIIWFKLIVNKALWNPSIDVRENDKDIIIHADLPGVKKEDIDMHLENDILTLSGHKKEQKVEQGTNTYRKERMFGSFTRRMRVPKGIKEADIKAKYLHMT